MCALFMRYLHYLLFILHEFNCWEGIIYEVVSYCLFLRQLSCIHAHFQIYISHEIFFQRKNPYEIIPYKESLPHKNLPWGKQLIMLD